MIVQTGIIQEVCSAVEPGCSRTGRVAESAVRPRIESQTQAYIFDSPKSGSRHRLPSSVPAQYLRWHAEGPEERATHAFAVHETCFLRHDIDRVPSLFDHEPSGLQPKSLHGFCWRLAGLAQKGAAELAGA
jgi:hypothetical protein